MCISELFQRVGAPLANIRRSWGGVRRDGAVVLRVWQNETRRIDGQLCIRLTHHRDFAGKDGDLGYQERLHHVAQIQAGASCYMVMCEPMNTKDVPRRIKRFNERELFRAGELAEQDGDLWVPLASREPIH